MVRRSRRATLLVGITLILSFALPASTLAINSWGGYHWSRSANPFTVRLGDAVNSGWDGFLSVASTEWSKSTVLDTTIVNSSVNPRKCRATSTQVNVCSFRYGDNGWLGLARIWVSGSHIYKSTVQLNDTYFTSGFYDTPAWRNTVMCQEIGHVFGLDHQDEDFDNNPPGSCMDYSSDPGPNQVPNGHDYGQLETIYQQLDQASGGGSKRPKKGRGNGQGMDQSRWGRRVAVSDGGRTSVHVKGLGGGKRVVTFVIWA